MTPVTLLRRLGRRVASRVADRVAKNELFEQHGERPPQPPLAPHAEPLAPPEAGAALSGCVPMGSGEVLALLGPTGQARVVNHWATWCDPCIEELPLLVRLQERLGTEAAVIGVSWDLEGGAPAATAEKVKDFAAQHGLTWGSALVTDPPEAFFAALGIDWRRIPQTWVVSAEGAVIRRIEGVLDDVAVDELVAELTG